MSAILIASVLMSAPVEPEVLRARAALALAFAPAKPSYAASYQRAVDEAKPLVVFVRQPATAVPGCITVVVEAFPDVVAPAVVVGVPAESGLKRIDLPGLPTAEAIRAATGRTGAGPLLPGRCDGTTNCSPP